MERKKRHGAEKGDLMTLRAVNKKGREEIEMAVKEDIMNKN